MRDVPGSIKLEGVINKEKTQIEKKKTLSVRQAKMRRNRVGVVWLECLNKEGLFMPYQSQTGEGLKMLRYWTLMCLVRATTKSVQ